MLTHPPLPLSHNPRTLCLTFRGKRRALFQALYDELLSPSQEVREQAITAVASLSDTAGDLMIPVCALCSVHPLPRPSPCG